MISSITAELKYEPASDLSHARPGGVGLRSFRAIYPHISSLVKRSIKTLRRRDLEPTIIDEARRRGIAEEEISAWSLRVPDDLISAVESGSAGGSIVAAGLLNRDYWFRNLDLEGTDMEIRWQNLEKTLDHVNQLCTDHAWDIYLAYLPTGVQVEPWLTDESLWARVGVNLTSQWYASTSAIQTRMAQWAESRNVPFVDLTDSLRLAVSEADGRLYYLGDGHWTQRGNRVTAEAVANFLRGKQ